ncbi:hypothetical protein TNCV_4162011 [Trichonephila clavipes]|nr:hypothetical protein TNCV_4162011 [Trichonephila clavipes]
METVLGYLMRQEKCWTRLSESQKAKENRHLFIISRHNRDTTEFQNSREFFAATGTRVSNVTISRRINSWEKAVCKKSCCFRPDKFWEQESPFKRVQRSKKLEN